MKGLSTIGAALRQWPRKAMPNLRTAVQESLEQATKAFGARRALLAIEEEDEPWTLVATLDEGAFEWREEEANDAAEAIGKQLREASFYAEPPDGRRALVHTIGGTATVRDPLSSALRERFGGVPVLSIRLIAESLKGRLFLVEPAADRRESLDAAEAVGALIAASLEATVNLRDAIRGAVEQERIRVARDLHDGLLQSFTGIVLQLETAHSTMELHPDDARRMITETQATIMADQRELRRFVEQLRPRPGRRETPFDFAARLEDLRVRFARQWNISLVCDVENIDPLVSAFLGHETFRLIHEAVTNSAKHGRASRVHVRVRTIGSEMEIQVSDNGAGFPFQGRMTLDDIRQQGDGPNVLAERVLSLNGTLTVDSTESGAIVTMSVPLGWGAAGK